MTRDYGSKALVEATEADPRESETVIRFLDREAEITTRYGGGFVQSIDGVAGGERARRQYDWFFYVNGIESSTGAADVRVRGGDRIWWDYRDWTDAMRVPAVVGSWPQPFAHSSAGGERQPLRIECMGGGGACDTAAARLRDAGVQLRAERGARTPTHREGAPRLLVGPWREVRGDAAVDRLRGGPAENGVFAAFKGPVDGEYRLIGLDVTGAPSRDLGPRAGLVAAVKPGDAPPTWIVTGSARAAVSRAASALDQRDLGHRYAVAAPPNGNALALPLDPAGAG